MPLHIFLRSGDATGAYLSLIRSVNGFVSEDNVFFGKDYVGWFNFTSDCRHIPVVECGFPINILFNVIAHDRRLSRCSEQLVRVFRSSIYDCSHFVEAYRGKLDSYNEAKQNHSRFPV